VPKGPTRRRPQTQARLLDAAMGAFAELGFAGATIEEICRRAGYTTGAFYSNYSSKDELFFALFDKHARMAVARLAQAVSAEELAALLADLGPEEREWFLVSTEFTLYAIRNPRAARVLAAHDAALRAEIARLLPALFARMGRTIDGDLDEFARLVIAVREGSLAQSLVEPEQLPTGTLELRFQSLLVEDF
jgi:AcrR family transcriptional regulator